MATRNSRTPRWFRLRGARLAATSQAGAGWGARGGRRLAVMTPQSTTIATESRVESAPHPVLDIVVPVYNEEADLPRCVRRLSEYVAEQLPLSARITIADNASTDDTAAVAERLAAEFDTVRVLHLDRKGRGRALKAAWADSDATVVAYMDVDLSTDLNALLPLVAPLLSGHSDIAIGTRLDSAARVVRGPKRELISRGYNLLLRTSLQARFSDAQCGFKAMRTDIARRLLPLVEDGEWFFDTELLVLAERAGLRIHEVPVDWVDDPDSRVDLADTVRKDLLGVCRLARALATGSLPLDELRRAAGREPLVPGVPRGMVGQLVRFGLIGIASTLAYLVLYLALQPLFGGQAANFLALLVTAIGNTAANRVFTFGVRGRRNAARHQVQGLLIFALGLAITSGALFVLHHWTPRATRELELLVLIFANLAATVSRFVGLRLVFRAPAPEQAVDR
ncbi:MAG: bifunctional glycosyltransferase family 2/GtrA family protein [Mycobacteriaceae bacterium]|nr:bifunctional glycosyltransferase family 2/GtrA family protein [Mycobacteriaceae bacterium]